MTDDRIAGAPSALDLNRASPAEIARLPRIGPARAEALAWRRPLRSWDDLNRVPGFSEQTVERLRRAGARLDPAPSTRSVRF